MPRASTGIAVAVLLAIPCAALATPSGRADAPVRATLDRAREVVLQDTPRAEQLAALRGLARELVDTRQMGRRALGDALERESSADQEEFSELFDEFIVRAYLQRLLFFRDPVFAFDEVRYASDDTALVPTRILTSKDEFFVDYQMHRRDERWLATDIVVEGISLRENYGEQFTSLLRTRSFEELLDLMRRKLRVLEARDEP